METTDWTKFSKIIKINTTIENVYKHWTTPKLLCIWFLKSAVYYDSNGSLKNDSELIQAKDTYIWKWHNYDGEEKGVVTKANGKNLLEFTFAETTKVTIKLTQQKNVVALELIQSSIPTDDANKFKIYCGCSNGWTFWLANLKAYLEHNILLHETDLGNLDDKLSCNEYVNV